MQERYISCWSVGGTPTTTNSAGNFVTERVWYVGCKPTHSW